MVESLVYINMRRAYKFRLLTNKIQEIALNNLLTGARNLYNAALEERNTAYKYRKISINYYEQCAELSEARIADEQLKLLPAQVCQDVLRRLDKAHVSFFKRVKCGETPGHPRFKSANRFNSITFPQYPSGARLSDKLYIQNIGTIKIKLHRKIEGKIKTVTIKREVNKWYAIFSCDGILARQYPKVDSDIGIDVGLESFATFSTGEKINNPRWYRKAETKLKKAQQELSRKKRHSKRCLKAKNKIAKISAKVVNQRKDFHHKLAHKIVSENSTISVEDLDIDGMIHKSSTGLAKSIYDAGWNQFITILSVKAEEAGRKFVKVDPRGTSSTCSACGAFRQKLLSERVHSCPCGCKFDRDLNAALNIKRLGRSLQGCIT